MALLELDDVRAGYSKSTVLQGVTLSVEEGTVTSLLGRNGVGKTTTLRTITGRLTPESGTITFKGEEINGTPPSAVHDKGIGMVTEDRGVFPELTVRENLLVPKESRSDTGRSIDDVYEDFPKLQELQDSEAGNLSGGEQQMLVIARALRSGPELLLLDEPSEGLAPQIVENVADIVRDVVESGTTVLLVEQNVNLALDLADYNYVMDQGRIVLEETSENIRANPDEAEQYLSIRRRSH